MFGGVGRVMLAAMRWVFVPTEAPKSAHWFADARAMQGITVGNRLVGVPSWFSWCECMPRMGNVSFSSWQLGGQYLCAGGGSRSWVSVAVMVVGACVESMEGEGWLSCMEVSSELVCVNEAVTRL